MNQRFFSLPAEKQQATINAGHRLFSQNSYKNSPMSEISAAIQESYHKYFNLKADNTLLNMIFWKSIYLRKE